MRDFMHKTDLDGFDRRLLMALQQDGRAEQRPSHRNGFTCPHPSVSAG